MTSLRRNGCERGRQTRDCRVFVHVERESKLHTRAEHGFEHAPTHTHTHTEVRGQLRVSETDAQGRPDDSHSASLPLSLSDYVYFENSSSNPYLIRRIEELNKVSTARPLHGANL